jgi:hypothetical protein
MTYTKNIKKRLEKIILEYLEVDINENSRKHSVIRGRMIAYKIMREKQCVKAHISKSFKQNHATVLHHLNRFSHLYKHDISFREEYNKVFNIYRAIDPSITGTIKEDEIKTITKRIDNHLYNLVDQVPEHHRNDVKIRLEAMIAGFGIKPRNQQATIYNVGSTSMA